MQNLQHTLFVSLPTCSLCSPQDFWPLGFVALLDALEETLVGNTKREWAMIQTKCYENSARKHLMRGQLDIKTSSETKGELCTKKENCVPCPNVSEDVRKVKYILENFQ